MTASSLPPHVLTCDYNRRRSVVLSHNVYEAEESSSSSTSQLSVRQLTWVVSENDSECPVLHTDAPTISPSSSSLESPSSERNNSNYGDASRPVFQSQCCVSTNLDADDDDNNNMLFVLKRAHPVYDDSDEEEEFFIPTKRQRRTTTTTIFCDDDDSSTLTLSLCDRVLYADEMDDCFAAAFQPPVLRLY
jgi:hypothetical protein